MLVLELFSGTGSVGKNSKKRGYKVLSVDNDETTNADVITDILKWDYKSLNLKPDFIWASPPCGSFTNMAITSNKNSKVPQRSRHTSMKPLNELGVVGDKVLKKTIEIINYYRRLNPRLKFVMENPHGTMWRSPYMKALKPYSTANTLYCLYKDERRKPTDFFNNFNLELKNVKNDGNCRALVSVQSVKTGARGGVKDEAALRLGKVGIPLCDRYRIPQKLLDEIFRQFKTNKVA
jgi:hypothetical protein